jgi:hypothetical protein
MRCDTSGPDKWIGNDSFNYDEHGLKAGFGASSGFVGERH